MNTYFDKELNFADISPLTLAFIGDAVYDLLAREYVVSMANRPANELNKFSVCLVNANSQAMASKLIFEKLNEEEQTIFKRGRNAHSNHSPRGAGSAEYHAATGIEALFGYLYLKGHHDRISELFKYILENTNLSNN